MLGPIVCWMATASAQDEKDGGGEEPPIVVKDLDEYEKMVEGLETDLPEVNEAWQWGPGTTEVRSPAGDDRGELGGVGHIVTRGTETAFPWGTVTEDWIVYLPEQVLLGDDAEMQYDPGDHRDAQQVQDDYAALPGQDYGALHFVFQYRRPPPDTAISALPTEIPWFVTEARTYRVFTIVGGVETESGALYRERIEQLPGEVWWRDVWVLWEDYSFTGVGATPDAVTRLEYVNAAPQTMRQFLRSQPSTQVYFAQMRSQVTVLP
jgi:hypothetical protein